MITLEWPEEEILRQESGKVIKVNEDFGVVEIEMDKDHSFTSIHIDYCVGFKPVIGDKVIVIDTNREWRVEKCPYSSVE